MPEFQPDIENHIAGTHVLTRSIGYTIASVVVAAGLGIAVQLLASLGIHKSPLGAAFVGALVFLLILALATCGPRFRGKFLNIAAMLFGALSVGLVFLLIHNLGQGMSK